MAGGVAAGFVAVGAQGRGFLGRLWGGTRSVFDIATDVREFKKRSALFRNLNRIKQAPRFLQLYASRFVAPKLVGNVLKFGRFATRGIGVVNLVSGGFGVADLIRQGNPIRAFQENGAGYVKDVAGTAFDLLLGAAILAPVAIGTVAIAKPLAIAAAVAGVVWAGATIWEHRDVIGRTVKNVATSTYRAAESGARFVSEKVDAGVRLVNEKAKDVVRGVTSTAVESASNMWNSVTRRFTPSLGIF